MQSSSLQKATQVLLFFSLVITVLYLARPFLVPFCFAALLAMLFLPLSVKLETLGLNRPLAILACIVILLAVIAVIAGLLTWQISDLVKDLGNVEERAMKIFRDIKTFIAEKFGVSEANQQKAITDQTAEGGRLIAGISAGTLGLLVDFILVLVYVFLFIFYKERIRKFILKVVPHQKADSAEDAIGKIQKVSQQYLAGTAIMIACLWVMYSIGFSIIGLKNPVFFALLCGSLELVPFVGNLTGNFFAGIMALVQDGGMSLVLSVVIVYAVIQFLQTYLLEPLVVGTGVNLNPLFTIIALVAGELVWGIPGLVLAIPLMGIVKIVCDHIPALEPYGYLMGREKKSGFGDAMRKWLHKFTGRKSK